MGDSFENPFDLSKCQWGTYFYHWCCFDKDTPVIQKIDLRNIDDVKKDILQKGFKGPYKVIRTVEAFNVMLEYINKIESVIIGPNCTADELFLREYPFLVDVTNEIKSINQDEHY